MKPNRYPLLALLFGIFACPGVFAKDKDKDTTKPPKPVPVHVCPTPAPHVCASSCLDGVIPFCDYNLVAGRTYELRIRTKAKTPNSVYGRWASRRVKCDETGSVRFIFPAGAWRDLEYRILDKSCVPAHEVIPLARPVKTPSRILLFDCGVLRAVPSSR